jgi:hypothetical protein
VKVATTRFYLRISFWHLIAQAESVRVRFDDEVECVEIEPTYIYRRSQAMKTLLQTGYTCPKSTQVNISDAALEDSLQGAGASSMRCLSTTALSIILPPVSSRSCVVFEWSRFPSNSLRTKQR